MAKRFVEHLNQVVLTARVEGETKVYSQKYGAGTSNSIMARVRAQGLKTNIFIKPSQTVDPAVLAEELKKCRYVMLTGGYLDTSEKKDKNGQVLQGQFWYNLNPRWSSTFLIHEGEDPGINSVLLVGEVTQEALVEEKRWLLVKMDYKYFSPKEKKEVFSHRIARVITKDAGQGLKGRTIYVQGKLSSELGGENNLLHVAADWALVLW